MKPISNKSPPLIVDFPSSIGYTAIETIIDKFYKKSIKEKSVYIDLSAVTWIGHFSCVLLFAWIASLRRTYGVEVTVFLPEAQHLSDQVKKALLRSRVIEQIRTTGAIVQGEIPTQQFQGIPLTVIDRLELLPRAIHAALHQLSSSVGFDGALSNAIRHAFSVVLEELGENAFIHSKSDLPAFFQVNVATSTSQTKVASGLVHSFSNGTRYAEIIFGDLGIGLNETLEASIPNEYTQVNPRSPELSLTELAIKYAFEFSSTSDIEGRQSRIAKTLASPSPIDARHVATGLFCVAEIAQQFGGQIIVRTPKVSAGLDFSKDRLPGSPKFTARRRKLKPSQKIETLPGTQYWLRIPLDFTANARSAKPLQVELDATLLKVLAIESFGSQIPQSTEVAAAEIQSIIVAAENAIRSIEKIHGGHVFLAVLPPLRIISTRVSAVMAYSLERLARNHKVVWFKYPSQNHFEGLSSINEVAEKKPFLTASLNKNEFEDFFTKGEKKLTQLTEINYKELLKITFDKLRESIANIIKLPDVRRSDGAFFLGNYYTNVFYDVTQVLKTNEIIESISSLAAYDSLLHKFDHPLTAVLSLSVQLNKLVKPTADIINQKCGIVIDPIECPSAAVPNWINSRIFARGHKCILVLTDVICSGDTVTQLLANVAKHINVHIFTLVDARADRPMVADNTLQVAGHLVPVSSVLVEQIRKQADPSASWNTNKLESRIYEMDINTKALSLKVFPTSAHITTAELVERGINKSASIMAGHIEHQGRHFNYFMDQERMMGFYKTEVVAWVSEKLSQLRGTRTSPVGATWHIRQLITDDVGKNAESIWLDIEKENSLINFDFRPLLPSQFDLVEQQKTKPEGHFVVLIPSMDSGNNCRRVVEWAALQKAYEVVLLVMVNRMEPKDFRFFSRIQKFESTLVSIHQFIDTHAFNSVGSDRFCGVCSAIDRFNELGKHAAKQQPKLSSLLVNKAQRLQVRRTSEFKLDDSWHPTVSDVLRAQTRLDFFEKFTHIILPIDNKGPNDIHALTDAQKFQLLQMIAAEQPDPTSPAHPWLESFEGLAASLRVYARDLLSENVSDDNSRIDFSKIVAALAQLCPDEFVENASSLIIRFADSGHELEEIITTLIALRSGSEKLVDDLRLMAESLSDLEIKKLVDQAIIFITSRTLSASDNLDEFVETFTTLQAELSRSRRVPLLAPKMLEENFSSTDSQLIKQEILEIVQSWKSEPEITLQKIEKLPRWGYLVEGTHISADISSARRAIAVIYNDVRLIDVINPSASKERLTNSLRDYSQAVKNISSFLNSFIANPLTQTELITLEFDLPKPICTERNEEIKVEFDISREDIELGFVHTARFGQVCQVIIDNWVKHGQKSDAKLIAKFSAKKIGQRIVMSFWDNFDGDFAKSSVGGLALVKNYGEECGAEIQFEKIGGGKQITINLVALGANNRKV